MIDSHRSRGIALWCAAAAFCLIAVSVAANPLLLAPTGTTLTTGQFRIEAALSPANDHGNYGWFAAGFQQWELNATRTDRGPGAAETILGVQWNFLPETSFTPAVSFGVRDPALQSVEGIGVYLAVTRHLPIGASSRFLRDFALTAGFGVGGIQGPIVAFEARLPWRLFAQAEYESGDVNAALGWQPSKHLRFKAYTIRSELYYGAEIVPLAF